MSSKTQRIVPLSPHGVRVWTKILDKWKKDAEKEWKAFCLKG